MWIILHNGIPINSIHPQTTRRKSMVNLLPTVLIGGPPHAGKSVLFYQITQALRERNIPHHAIRACPDGEGNWYHEANPETVSTICRKLTEWPAEFVNRMCEDLEHRCLPFLVDVGGRPKSAEMNLFRLCTHSILLLRADKPADTQLWQHMVEESNLLPLALLSSQQAGNSVIHALSPMLEGTFTGLERHLANAGHGPLFNELVERIAALFRSYTPQKSHFEHAPTELALDLNIALQSFTTASTRWEPAMLLPFLTSLPAQTPLSVYGIGPNWLYAALSAYEDQQPFYLFDPKLPFGWIQPARVYLGIEQSPEIHIEQLKTNQAFTILKITFPNDRIAYFQPDPLAFPPLPLEQGVIIDGRVPYWLLTALVRLYKEAGITWIATYYPQLEKAVVVYSRVPTHILGDLVPMPA